MIRAVRSNHQHAKAPHRAPLCPFPWTAGAPPALFSRNSGFCLIRLASHLDGLFNYCKTVKKTEPGKAKDIQALIEGLKPRVSGQTSVMIQYGRTLLTSSRLSPWLVLKSILPFPMQAADRTDKGAALKNGFVCLTSRAFRVAAIPMLVVLKKT